MFPVQQRRPRNLVLNRAKRVADRGKNRQSLTSFSNVQNTRADTTVQPGEELLFSFFEPSLLAGHYTANITQDIKVVGKGELSLKSTKEFQVVGSRFALEKEDISSFYPPQGHGDFNTILPHVVFNDQHLPWIRSGKKDADPPIPWLALFVFTVDELTVQDFEQLSLPKDTKQDSAGGVQLTFEQIFTAQGAGKLASPFKTDDPEKIDEKTSAKFIFVPETVFDSLFCKYDPQTGSSLKMENADTSRYTYLAHCRKINTEGMPEDIVTEEEQRLYSIVVAHRTAPIDLVETTSVSVHLVSIEGVEGMQPEGNRVAMCSLHSWTYNVFPASMPTVQQRLHDLGETLDVLRLPQDVLDVFGVKHPRLKARAESGYTLVRYHVSTGDQTIAFTRSPFVPGIVEYPIPNLPRQSLNAGTDLQILDQDLGIMDITYASAWQLGKSLAMADRSFAIALVRLRTIVAVEAVKQVRLDLAEQLNYTLEKTLENLKDSLERISSIAKPDSITVSQTAAGSMTDEALSRWYRPAGELLNLTIGHHAFSGLLQKHCSAVISKLSLATDGHRYGEYNTAISPEWQRVFTFILDILSLYSVPPDYLVPDPTLLPEESLRFFSIDKNWTDALIDGALSLANHQLPEIDRTMREGIYKEIQSYLNTEDEVLRYKPQVPTYGMLLRSEIVSKFPSLTIRAPIPVPDHPVDNEYLRAPILRQTVIADGTLLVLFDRVPGSVDLPSLTIQMPPHEQRFSVGQEIQTDYLKVVWKRIYTENVPTERYAPLKTSEYKPGQQTDSSFENIAIYDWSSRALNMHSYVDTADRYLQEIMPKDYTEQKSISARGNSAQRPPL